MRNGSGFNEERKKEEIGSLCLVRCCEPISIPMKRTKEKKGSLRLLRCCEPISFMLGFGQYHHRQTTHLYCAHYLDHRTAPPFSQTPTNTMKFCTIFFSSLKLRQLFPKPASTKHDNAKIVGECNVMKIFAVRLGQFPQIVGKY